MRRLIFISLLIHLFSCASLASAPKTELSERSGGLKLSDLPAKTIEITADTITVWATVEAAGKVRKQALSAALDALLRAELVKYVEVSVASYMKDFQDTNGQQIDRITVELIRAKYHGFGHIERGLQAEKQNEGLVTTMIGRMRISRSDLSKLIQTDSRMAEAGPQVLERLFKESQ